MIFLLIAGFLKDISGQYELCLTVGGSFAALTGLILLIVLIRKHRQMSQYNVTSFHKCSTEKMSISIVDYRVFLQEFKPK